MHSSKKTDLSERYQIATHKALAQAIISLEPRMKIILNYYYYDNLTLKQIGQIFAVHEATASRWVARIQQAIRQAVEKFLKQEYRFNSVQIKECLEYAAQSEGIDIKSLLAETEPPNHGS